MKRIVFSTWLCLIAVARVPLSYAQIDGALPIPTLKNVQVDATVSYDPGQKIYQYHYAVANPSTNTGIVERIFVDIRSVGPAYGDGNALTIAAGNRTPTFLEDIEGLSRAVPMVPVGIAVPAGWHGSIWARGVATFLKGVPPFMGPGDSIAPGQSRSGFVLKSFTTPTLREMSLIPDWIYISTSPEGVSEEESQRAAEIEDSLPDHVVTLGPSAVVPGSFEHWNELRDSLQRAISLGWVSDETLAQQLTSQLASARTALDAADGTTAESRLQQLLATMAASGAAQRRSEVSDLVTLNAQSLTRTTADTPARFEPKVTFTPAETTLPIGSTYALTALAVNLGDNQPLEGYPIDFTITEGPHGLRSAALRTGTDGRAVFSYVGTKVGHDRIAVEVSGDFATNAGVAEVTWTAGPDLAVPLFAPPVLRSQGGNDAVIHDETANISETAAAPPSVTRYYLGDSSPVEIESAIVLGERSVPVLAPGETNGSPGIHVRLPDDLPQGTYYLAACADAPGEIVELD